MKPWNIRSILVPFDFSGPSLAALAVAKDAAAHWDAQLELLHVRALPLVYAGLAPGSGQPELEPQQSADTLRRLMHDAAAGCKKIRTHILEGNPKTLVRRLGEDAAADLIVMGTHGYTGIDRLLMPSIVEAVVRGAQAPVLSVHANAVEFKPARILVPLNFSAHSDAALARGIMLAEKFHAKLHLLHVLEPWFHPTVEGEAATRQLEETADSITGLEVTTQLSQGSAVSEILQTAAAGRCDLIVLAGHPRRVGKELMIGTTAERTLRHSPIPVLAVPTEARAKRRHRAKAAAGQADMMIHTEVRGLPPL